MTDRDRPYAEILGDAEVQFWICLNPAHKNVEWSGDVATCPDCGLTSDMTREFAEVCREVHGTRIASDLEALAREYAGDGFSRPQRAAMRHALEVAATRIRAGQIGAVR